MSENLKTFVAMIAFVVATYFAADWASDSRVIKEDKGPKDYIEETYESKNQIRSRLVANVQSYIDRKGRGKSNVKASVVVDACLKHEVPIQLLLAQGTLESHWGTEGRSLKSKSVFGVGSYDDGTDAVVYADVNKSVHAYARFVKNDYLQNKDLDTLLVSYVNYKGHRYSSNDNYEQDLKTLIAEIDQSIIDDFSELL